MTSIHLRFLRTLRARKKLVLATGIAIAIFAYVLSEPYRCDRTAAEAIEMVKYRAIGDPAFLKLAGFGSEEVRRRIAVSPDCCSAVLRREWNWSYWVVDVTILAADGSKASMIGWVDLCGGPLREVGMIKE